LVSLWMLLRLGMLEVFLVCVLIDRIGIGIIWLG